MKIIVTGGAGFIGSNFIRYWLGRHADDRIVNLDALTYAGNPANLADLQDDRRYRFVKGDITDREIVDPLMRDADLIVHFAAESHVDRSIADSADFVRSNVEGTRVLLDAARAAGNVRFHHISTDEVFGSLGPGDLRFNERTPYDPRSPYSASKAASDHLVRAYFHTHGSPVTITNCTNNYGPYHFPEKLIPLFITNLLEGKKVPVYGRGLNIRDWIHVDDHVAGVEAVITKGVIGETYCLGGENEIANIDLTRKILALMGEGEEMIEFVGDRPGHDQRYAMDCTRAERELGWRPLIGLDQGLAATVDWYRAHPDWWRSVKNGSYREYYERQYGGRAEAAI